MLKSRGILGTKQWKILRTHAAFVCLRCRCFDVERRISMLLEERMEKMQWMELVNEVLTYCYSYFPVTLLTVHIYYPKSF